MITDTEVILPLPVANLDQVPSAVIPVTWSILSHAPSAPLFRTLVKLPHHFAYDSTNTKAAYDSIKQAFQSLNTLTSLITA